MVRKLLLDPGHGGHDPGALNRHSGLTEAEVVLDVCKRMADILRPAIHCGFTRGADYFVPLRDRAQHANDWGADAYLSVHCNAAHNEDARGYEFFTSPGSTDSDGWATALLNSYGQRFPSMPARVDYADGDPDKEAGFYVLRHTQMPAVLAELEFISNAAGAEFLASAQNRQAMAAALAAGTAAWMEIDHTASPGKSPAQLQEGAYYWFRVGDSDFVDRVVNGEPSWATGYSAFSGPLASPDY